MVKGVKRWSVVLVKDFVKTNSYLRFNGQRVVIFGGKYGFGQVVADQARQAGLDVSITTRQPRINSEDYCFEFNKEISEVLLELVCRADYIILNANKTLERDESAWNTTLETFDEHLALDRFITNGLGYVKLLKSIMARRKTLFPLREQKIIWIDANESKYGDKMIDGKHLELNMAKSAVKQIFYTNAKYFALLKMNVICYDPGWMSYHGIELERSRRNELLSPVLSAKAMFSLLNDSTMEDVVEISVYDILRAVPVKHHRLSPIGME